MPDLNHEIAELMDKRRFHLRCMQEVERLPIMAAAKEKHEKIARECGERIKALCAQKRLTGARG
jgi:hypothetical protein